MWETFKSVSLRGDTVREEIICMK